LKIKACKDFSSVCSPILCRTPCFTGFYFIIEQTSDVIEKIRKAVIADAKENERLC
jgi:hypothetical protein